MAKCSACGKFLATKGGATCSRASCCKRYHLACLLLPETAQMSSDWQCPDCKKKVPRGDNSFTPVKDLSSGPNESTASTSACTGISRSPVRVAQVESVPCTGGDNQESPPTLREEIRLFRSELREVRDELREFRRQMNELHSSYGDCMLRVDGLEGRVLALENRPIVAAPDTKVSALESTVAQLQLELNDRDQELLGSDLEIANLPEVSGESVLHTVGLVAAKLGVVLDERDIVFAERVGRKTEREVLSGGGAGSAAAAAAGDERGAARGRYDELLRSARVRRGVNTADLGFPGTARRFFLNERLTRTNKSIFYHVREAVSRLGWKYAWVRSGRILAKQGDGQPTYCIRSDRDLERVFGIGSGTVKETT